MLALDDPVMKQSIRIWLLLGLACPPLAKADLATVRPTTSGPRQTVETTIDRGIGYIQTESRNWMKTSGCAACHHAPLPLWALARADQQGYQTDRKYVADTVQSILGGRDKLIATKVIAGPNDPPDPRPLARGVNMGAVYLIVAAGAMPALTEAQTECVRQLSRDILPKLQPDGSFEFFLRRPPMNESQSTDTEWILLALEYGPSAGPWPERDQVAARTRAWLELTPSTGTLEDLALRLVLEARRGPSRPQTAAAAQQILSRQRSDGGWSQTPELTSDAFATGHALYALAQAGIGRARGEIRKGVDFLVRTQEKDGSWRMLSRSTPDGRPGGATRLGPITCAAASWAVLGLVEVAPKRVSGHANNSRPFP